jgi:hypothetical protein
MRGHSLPMSFISDAELADDRFFGALLAGDAVSLDTVLLDRDDLDRANVGSVASRSGPTVASVLRISPAMCASRTVASGTG